MKKFVQSRIINFHCFSAVFTLFYHWFWWLD